MSRSRVIGAGTAEGLLEGFVGYLRSERGVTVLTVEVYVSDVRRFLAQRGDSDLRGLTAAEVSNAVLGQVGERAPATVRRFGCALRSFLRYCYLVGDGSTRDEAGPDRRGLLRWLRRSNPSGVVEAEPVARV